MPRPFSIKSSCLCRILIPIACTGTIRIVILCSCSIISIPEAVKIITGFCRQVTCFGRHARTICSCDISYGTLSSFFVKSYRTRLRRPLCRKSNICCNIADCGPIGIVVTTTIFPSGKGITRFFKRIRRQCDTCITRDILHIRHTTARISITRKRNVISRCRIGSICIIALTPSRNRDIII